MQDLSLAIALSLIVKFVSSIKAYSLDLRQKIIDVYDQEPISQRQLAKRFNVALSFIEKLLKQYRETGTIAPKPHGGGAQLKVTSEQLIELAELIEANNDATLEELGQLFQDQTGVTLTRATMGRMTQRLDLTVKKKHYTQPKKKLSECKNSEWSSGQKFNPSPSKT